MSRPAVTALIDTYNHEEFIEEAIVSVLKQDFPATEIEILVVDDGSTDGTPEIVKSFGGRVRLMRKANGGQASAFNAGIPEARGGIIAFLDGDDWWAASKISRVVEYFDAHPDVGVLGHGIHQVDRVARREFQTLPLESREFSFASEEGAAFFRQMVCFFGTSRLAIRSEIAARVLPVPERIVIEADEFLCIAAIARSRGALLKEPLTYYRLHENNQYQMRTADERKLRRMSDSLDAIASELPARLAAASVEPERIRILTEPLETTAKRIQLQLDGGMPWETFAVENTERRRSYSGGSIGYRLFELASLGLTLFLPPRRYYQLREWYSGSVLRQMRGILGEPVAASRIENISLRPMQR
jgi:hypothetical protein